MWQALGPRISSHNFKLRPVQGETGVSVNRKELTSVEQLLSQIPEEVLLRMGPGSQWRVAEARVSSIREFGFLVVADPKEDDPGHALILSDRLSLDEHAARKKLSRLFRFIEPFL